MNTPSGAVIVNPGNLAALVAEIVAATPVLDIHTHLLPPHFEQLSLMGIDELINYHYLVAETFRYSEVTPGEFWTMPKSLQADLIWKTLFVENTPLSEATRGVVRVLREFGLDPGAPTLDQAREFFAARLPEDHVNDVLARANVSDVVMTNDVFDPAETRYWLDGSPRHPRFHAVLRMDPMLNDWARAHRAITSQGYPAGAALDAASLASARKFLEHWIQKLRPLYLAVSLPPTFRYPEESARALMMKEVVLPACHAHRLPFAMMIGVRKQVNPALRDAGDSLGHAEAASVESLCLDYPENRFLVTLLSRENQHELCVAARKFSNLMPFGCWWFLNNPSIIPEITDERIELLGTSFIPQHSDARILDQLIYKWDHSRRIIAASLTRAYDSLIRDGWSLTQEHIQRDVTRLFQNNFRRFVGLPELSHVTVAAAR